MAAEISMDFEIVTAMADNVLGAVHQLETVDQTLRAAIAKLYDSSFTGLVGDALVEDYTGTIQPQLANVATALGELHSDLLGAIGSLRDGDLSGSQRFSGNGPAGSKTIPKGGKAKPIYGSDIRFYKDGKNGWEIIPMGDDFSVDELLIQQHGQTCVIYSTLNLMIENGYNLPQPVGDLFLAERIASNPDKVADFAADGEINYGFPTDDAKAILDSFGVSYQHGDFSTHLGPIYLGTDSDAAKKFLINQLKAGHPVWVTTQVDDSFGAAKGAHAETVIGVQMDKSGNLSSVLVATNDGAPKVVEIPASAFIDDWLNYNDGEYIVMTKPSP